MKKSFKLIATMCSLFLVAGILVFGVYAANIVTYNINSTVSYTFTDALFELERKIEIYSPVEPVVDLAALQSVGGQFVAHKDYPDTKFRTYTDELSYQKPQQAQTNQAGTSDEVIETGIDFDFSKGYCYRVTVSITSPASAGVDVTCYLPTTTQTNVAIIYDTASTIEASVENGIKQKNVKAEENAIVFRYYVCLKDQWKSVEGNLGELVVYCDKAN